MSASLKKSFADVTRRKGRTLLVVLGIFIGVLGLTGVNFIQQTIFAAFTYSAGTAANSPDMTLSVNKLDPRLSPQLSAVSNVQAVQMQSVFATQWHVSAGPGHVPITIVSYPDLQQVPITPFQLTGGRYPGVGEIVLEYGDQDIQHVSIGDTVTVDTSTTTTTTLRVVGFARTQGLPSPAGSGIAQGYMSEAAITQAFGSVVPVPGSQGPQVRQEVAVKVQNISQVTTTANALTQTLRAQGVAVLQVTITQPSDQGQINEVNGVFTLLFMLSVLAVMLSALLILNTVITLIAEQTPIIGTLKAVGGTRGAILRGYLLSVVIYSAVATLPAIALGLLLGYPLASFLLANTVRLPVGPFTIFPWIILLGLAVGFGVPLLSALLPLWMGTRITVREALSAYGISAGRAGHRGARLAQRLRWVSQTAWLGLRGIFRKRARAALTLLTLTLAGTTFLVVQTTTAATNQTIASAFAPYHYDVLAEVYAQNAPLVAEISALPNVQRVERYREDEGVESQWGGLRLLGVQPDTTLYTPQIVSGRWLSPGDTNAVLINEAAATATGLHVGDTLTLSRGQYFTSNGQPTEGNQATWTIIGIVHQPMYEPEKIGMVITSVENANQFFGDPADVLPELLVQARDHTASAVDALTRQIDHLVNGGNALNGGLVETRGQVVQERQQSWLIFYALLYSVALIVGVVGILGLANALAASVLERRREIGLLRAMGANSWSVARVFWVEGLALGGIAWLLGGLLGLPLAYGFIQVMSRLVLRVDFAIAPSALVVMLAAVLLISTLASIIPALRASRVRIADLLRYE